MTQVQPMDMHQPNYSWEDNSKLFFNEVVNSQPLVKKLKEIHDETFGDAAKKIKVHQTKYKRQYDEKNKVKNFTMKIGAKVQFKKHFSKKAKGAKSKIQYYPVQTYLVIHRIFRTKKLAVLKNLKTGYIHMKKNFSTVFVVLKVILKKKAYQNDKVSLLFIIKILLCFL